MNQLRLGLVIFAPCWKNSLTGWGCKDERGALKRFGGMAPALNNFFVG